MIENRDFEDLVIAKILIKAEECYKKTEDKDEEKELRELINRLSAFEHIQVSWLRSNSILADYHACLKAKIPPKLFTQSDLTQEAKKNLKNSFELAMAFADDLGYHITKNNYPNIEKNNKDLLNHAKKCTKIILGYYAWFKELIDLMDSHDIYHIAILLNARFIPSKQTLDPIKGETSLNDFAGACYGHVMAWRDEIMSNGKFLSQPRHNKKTYQEQKNHRYSYFKMSFNLIKKNFDDKNGFSVVVNDLLSNIQNDYLYYFGYMTRSMGHAMGLRTFKNSEVEFFDPNFGSFVFANIETFKIWLTALLGSYHRGHAILYLQYCPIGNQPPDSIATIPPFAKIEDTSENKRLGKIISAEQETYDAINNLLKLEASKSVLPNPEIDKQHAIALKNRAVKSINLEINRLSKNIIGDSTKKISALEELRAQIDNPDSNRCLANTIEEWLSQKNSNNETNQTIISCGRINHSKTKTDLFIESLLLYSDTNNAGLMRLLQAQLLLSMIKIIALYDNQLSENVISSLPSTVNEIKLSIASDPNRDISSHITHIKNMTDIKNRCSQNTVGIFSRSIDCRDETVDQSCQIIKNLDTDSPQSLIEAINQFGKLFNEIEAKYNQIKNPQHGEARISHH